MKSGVQKPGVQVIARAAEILRVLTANPAGLTLSEIAGQVGGARSTTHRILSALRDEDFVTRPDGSGRFKIGASLAGMGATDQGRVSAEFRVQLELLALRTRETVDISMLWGDRVLFTDQLALSQRLNAASAIGTAFPAHAVASGKALLAVSPAHAELVLSHTLERFTPKTIVDPESLSDELAQIRETGVALDREEHVLGICGVATVVRDNTGSWVAIGIPAPASRFYGQEDRLSEELLSVCRAGPAATGSPAPAPAAQLDHIESGEGRS